MHTSCHAGGLPFSLTGLLSINSIRVNVCFQQTFVLVNTYWRRLQGVFKTSSRRLQCNIFLSSKTSWRRLEDIIARRLANTSWRHLGRRKALRWRRLEVLKTSWKTRNVCWVKWRNRKMGFANVRTENTVMSNNNRRNYKIENLHTVVAYCCIIATTRKWDHVSLFLESK